MPKKKFDDDEDDSHNLNNDDKIINQEELTEEDISEIRNSFEVSTTTTENSKKIITGIRPNPPPKKSWWDISKNKFNAGNTLVPKKWNGDSRSVCRVCCPGKEIDTYMVKFSECSNESVIKFKDYILAPEDTEFIPYMDEYTKWRYNQNKKKKT